LLAGLENVPVDGPVLFMQAATAALISAFFACMPAWQLFRGTPGALSERSATAAGGGGYRVRGVLLAVEVALSLVLLLGAGLVLRSFTNLMRVEPGFQPERILTVQLQMPPQQTAFFRRVEEQVRAIPGVENVAAIEYLPLSGSGVTRRMLVDGRPRPEPGGEPIVQRHIVTTDYFRAMGIPLRSSGAFRDVDMQAQRLTVVINEAMARRYWQNQNPVGQYLKLGTQATVASAPLREIVGVVGDVRHSALRLDAKDEVYVPLGQDDWPVMNLIVRSATANPAALIPELKKAVWALDKNQPLPNMKLMTKIVADSVWQPRLNAVVLTAFAAVSLVLALAGIYGLMTRIVGDRTPEIGVRMAMGASPLSVLLLILRQGFIPVLIGGITGLALAGAGGRLVATQLYGVTPADPITLTASVTLIICSAFLAMAHPALRAARVDPMTALRHE
jgi:putative ABC transport system permease protein